jgi:hypothetical protein
MQDGWVAIADTASWLPVAAAYVFGLASGWLFWGGKNRSETMTVARQHDIPVDGAAGGALGEIAAARAVLDEGSAEANDAKDALAAADEALKRANGRLKILLDAVRKARLRD